MNELERVLVGAIPAAKHVSNKAHEEGKVGKTIRKPEVVITKPKNFEKNAYRTPPLNGDTL